MQVYNTTDWPPEKIRPYGQDITAALRKLQERFPRDVDIVHLFQEITTGKRQLWLILEEERFVSIVLTQIQINEGTGLKTLVIPSFAGEEGASTVPLIGALEDWGRENGCDEVMIFGRMGWKRAIAKEGYELDMAIFRKAL